MPCNGDGGHDLAEEAAILAHASSSAILRRWWPTFAVPLVLAGCFYQHHFMSRPGGGGPLDRSEASPDLVTVVAAKDADRPYRKIGVVHAPASLPESDAIAALQRRARSLGADALLDVRRQATDPSSGLASSAPAAAPWEADAIVWRDGQASRTPQPPPPGAKPPEARPP
jgi:hypothetical protein